MEEEEVWTVIIFLMYFLLFADVVSGGASLWGAALHYGLLPDLKMQIGWSDLLGDLFMAGLFVYIYLIGEKWIKRLCLFSMVYLLIRVLEQLVQIHLIAFVGFGMLYSVVFTIVAFHVRKSLKEYGKSDAMNLE